MEGDGAAWWSGTSGVERGEASQRDRRLPSAAPLRDITASLAAFAASSIQDAAEGDALLVALKPFYGLGAAFTSSSYANILKESRRVGQTIISNSAG